MLYTLCIILILIASILIILAVLVQNPKSGMAANFGASNQVMGVRQTSDFLEKFTWTMAVVIVVLSLLATLAMDRGLVARSNVELEKDANALMEKVIVEDPAPAVPQAELPASEQQPAPAAVPAELTSDSFRYKRLWIFPRPFSLWLRYSICRERDYILRSKLLRNFCCADCFERRVGARRQCV